MTRPMSGGDQTHVDTAVLVVHGIGAQVPGETLRKFTSGFRRVQGDSVPEEIYDGMVATFGSRRVRFQASTDCESVQAVAALGFARDCVGAIGIAHGALNAGAGLARPIKRACSARFSRLLPHSFGMQIPRVILVNYLPGFTVKRVGDCLTTGTRA